MSSDEDDWSYLFELVGHLGNFCAYAGANLDSVEMISCLPGLPGGRGWLGVVPNARRLVLACDEDDVDWDELPEFMTATDDQEPASVRLEEWIVAGRPVVPLRLLHGLRG